MSDSLRELGTEAKIEQIIRGIEIEIETKFCGRKAWEHGECLAFDVAEVVNGPDGRVRKLALSEKELRVLSWFIARFRS